MNKKSMLIILIISIFLITNITVVDFSYATKNTRDEEILNVNQSVFNRGFPIRYAIDGSWGGAQSFESNISTITRAEIYLRKFGSPTFDLKVEIRENNPTGTLLDTIVFTPAEVPTEWSYLNIDFDDITVTPDTKYFIVIPPPSTNPGNTFGYEWGYAFGNQYDDGSFWFTRDNGGFWRDLPTMYEFTFKTYGLVCVDEPPIACFAWERNSPDTKEMVFNASCSYDDIGIVLYEWDFTDDSIIDYSSTEPLASYNSNSTEPYMVTLTVTDTTGHTDTISQNVQLLTKSESIFEHLWHDGGDAITSTFETVDLNFEVADNFDIDAGSIDKVVAYGLPLKLIDDDWVEQTPDSTESFTVRFYEYETETIPGIVAPMSGTYKLALLDSHDHWNWGSGSFVSVFVNGVAVIDDATMLAEDTNPIYYEFEASEGDMIIASYTASEYYADENYYAILDPYGNLIAEQGGSWENPGDIIPTDIGSFTVEEPDWDNPVSEQVVDADVEFVDIAWETYSLYKFEMELPVTVNMNNGWVSVQSNTNSGSENWFLWMNSQDSDSLAYQLTNDLGVYSTTVLDYDLGFELMSYSDVKTFFDESGTGANYENDFISSRYPDIIRWREVEINQEIIIDINNTVGTSFVLNLFGDVYYNATIVKTQTYSETETITAKLDDCSYSWFILSTTNGKSLGNLQILQEDLFYQIMYCPDKNIHYLIEMSSSALSNLSGPFSESDIFMPTSTGKEIQNMPEKNLGAYDDATINLMTVYTTAAREWANQNGGIENNIGNAWAKAQLTLDNSETYLSLNHVHSAEVDYTEYISDIDLVRLTVSPDFFPEEFQEIEDEYGIPIAGYMDEVHEWRDTYAADLVQLFRYDPWGDLGGGSWPYIDGGSPEWAFSFCPIDWFTYSDFQYASIHEIGHSLGCGHHKEQYHQPGPGVFDYSAGWRRVDPENEENCYSTVMTYPWAESFPDGIYASHIPYFSNPDVNYQGEPIGDAVDGDNARTIRETKHIVASYRPIEENYRPNAPILDSPADGEVFIIEQGQTIDVELKATATDPNDDQIVYRFWDAETDNSIDTTWWHESGEQGSVIWEDLGYGTYSWYAKAGDGYDFPGGFGPSSEVRSFTIQDNAPNYLLTINYDGQGSVNLDPPGNLYRTGTQVELTAHPDDGWVFINWEGDLTGDTNPEIIIMDSDKTVTVHFEETPNQPPNTPDIPSGRRGDHGVIGNSYTYSTRATDQEEDDLRYRFDWGDGTVSSWTIKVDSGAMSSAEKTWDEPGIYHVKAQAIDTNFLESDWSDPLEVTITQGMPHLYCEGDLSFTEEVKPGSHHARYIFVQNDGDYDSQLYWDVAEKPGYVTLEPDHGYNILADGSWQTILVNIDVPLQRDQTFNSELVLRNDDDHSNIVILPISFVTSKSTSQSGTSDPSGPIADAGGPYSSEKNIPINFDFSGSYNSGDMTIEKMRIDLDGDGNWDTAGPFNPFGWIDWNPYPGYTYDTAGTYDMGLQVRNNYFMVSDIDTTTVEITGGTITNPSVNTLSAIDVDINSATLRGDLTSLGDDSSCYVRFEYGTTTSYEYYTDWVYKLSTGEFSKSVSGLDSDTTYHYRAVASNSVGDGYGYDEPFTTETSPLATIQGHVYNNLNDPLNSAHVVVFTDDETLVYDDYTDNNGYYSMTVEPNTYYITVTATNYDPIEHNGPYTITNGQTLTIDFYMNASANLFGYVRDTEGNLIGGAKVQLDNGQYAYTYSIGGMLGFYSFDWEVCPGTYDITASKSGYYDETVYNYEISQGANQLDFIIEEIIYPPSVSTLSASIVGPEGATVHGDLTNLGGDSSCNVWFEYGQTTAYGSSTTPISQSDTGEFSRSISGLDSETTYHYRAVASNTVGTNYGLDRTFTTTTLVLHPTVCCLETSNIGQNSVTLTATLTSDGGEACHLSFYIQQGTTTVADWTKSGTYNSPYTYSHTFTGLSPGTNYVAYANVLNSAGGKTIMKSFTTSSPPTVNTLDATSVASYSANLNGNLVNMGGASSCTVWFVYDTSSHSSWQDYAYSTSTITKTSTGTFYKTASSLQPSTTYHFRAVAQNTQGTSQGVDEYFTTSTCFLAGTKIAMADNTYKNIEDIQIGDFVKSYDQEKQITTTGTVLNIYHHTSPEQMAKNYLIINNVLKVTNNHPIYINKKWNVSGEIKIGDKLQDTNGKEITVKSIEKIIETVPTYNLEVEKYHTYYAEDILVHNKDTPGWVRPYAAQDTTGWQNENNARDTSTSTYSHYYRIGDYDETDYALTLTYSSVLSCNEIKIDALKITQLVGMTVKLYEGNNLKKTCSFSTWQDHSYTYESFSTVQIDKVEIDFTLGSGLGYGVYQPKVYDFQVYRVV